MEHKMDWIDVIIITVNNSITKACPPSGSASVSASPVHIAKKPDGSWVKSNWNPEAVFKNQTPITLPETLDMPCKFEDRYCAGGTTQIIVPYSETVLNKVKVYQTELVEGGAQFIALMLAKK